MNGFKQYLEEQAKYPKSPPVLESALKFPYTGPASLGRCLFGVTRR
jgi:hypothetical protein